MTDSEHLVPIQCIRQVICVATNNLFRLHFPAMPDAMSCVAFCLFTVSPKVCRRGWSVNGSVSEDRRFGGVVLSSVPSRRPTLGKSVEMALSRFGQISSEVSPVKVTVRIRSFIPTV